MLKLAKKIKNVSEGRLPHGVDVWIDMLYEVFDDVISPVSSKYRLAISEAKYPVPSAVKKIYGDKLERLVKETRKNEKAFKKSFERLKKYVNRLDAELPTKLGR